MKKLLFSLLLIFAGLSARGAWQTELTTELGSFPPLRPFHAHYKFGWGVVGAAEADFDYSKGKPAGTGRLVVSTRSVGAVRALWKMDAEHIALMQLASLQPISVQQTETYGDKTHTTKLDFTPSSVNSLRESTPSDGKPAKPKRFDFPGALDLHSAIHFIRSQRLKTGDTYKIVVYPAACAYLAEVTVAAREKIKAANEPHDAIKLDLKLAKINKHQELEKHGKFKRASIWLSDDANRMLLRIEAEIFVGSVWGELDKIEYK